jgi:hypothetical protein
MSNLAQAPEVAGGQESSVAGPAQGFTSQAQEKAQELKGSAGSRVREEIDNRSTHAGEQIASVAAAMRKMGEQLRGEGDETSAKYVDRAGERIERFGAYLTEANADRILGEIENFGRRQPWAAALGGGILSLVAARFLKASGRRRYDESLRSENSMKRATAPSTPQYQEL